MFSEVAANRWLEQLTADYAAEGAEFHAAGGYKVNGKCTYDAYVAVGARAQYGASLAIRLPKGGQPYYAIVRKSKGRRITEDKLPFDQPELAADVFRACVAIASLQAGARTSVWSAELEASNP